MAVLSDCLDTEGGKEKLSTSEIWPSYCFCFSVRIDRKLQLPTKKVGSNTAADAEDYGRSIDESPYCLLRPSQTIPHSSSLKLRTPTPPLLLSSPP